MHRRALVSILLFVFLLVYTPAHADYRSDYLSGLDAVRQGRWAEALRRFEQAAREHPTEGGTIRRSYLQNETYLPHYYIGVAAAELGDCERAVSAWKTSESQGVIQSQREFSDLGRRKSACESRLSASRPAAPPAAPAVPPPTVACSQPVTVQTSESSATVRYNEPVVTGGAEPVRLACSPPSGSLFTAGSSTVTCVATDARGRTAECRTEVNVLLTPREVTPAVVPPPRPPVAPPTTTSRANTEPAGSALPAQVIDAAQAYFDRDYVTALRLLASAEGLEKSVRGYALLFRAAARFAMFQLGGAADGSIRQAAERDARAARADTPTLRPAPRYFSPRFIEFFNAASR